MSGVGNVNAALPLQAGAGALPGSAAAAALLPGPGAEALSSTDPLSVLYLLQAKDGQDGEKTGAARVKGLEADRATALKKEQEAIRAQDEAAKSHGFLDQLANVCGEVAKVAGVVGSIAAAVGTCGAATPIAAVAIGGAVLSTAGFADGELHVLQKLGIDDKTAGWIDMGLSMGGLGASVGAGLAAGEQTASRAAEVVSRTAAEVTGAATVGKGVSEIESGQALAAEDRATADQLADEARTDGLKRSIESVIAEIEDADQQTKQITGTIAATKTLQDQTLTLAASSVKG
jgi:hypothetical protein